MTEQRVAKRWYVIHTQTGQEEKVRSNLESKLQGDLKELISQIFIPTETVSEVKDGKKKISQRKFFPGYVLVEMDLNEKSWYAIRNTPGVSGFVGSGRKPLPLPEEQIRTILKQTEEKKEKPSPKVVFERGEAVKVIEGPFTNFNGNIDEVNPDKGRLKVMVSIFGRATPVELEYWQVEKI